MTKMLNLGREGAQGSAVAWPHPPVPGCCAALGLKTVKGPEVWLWGGDVVKPFMLGSLMSVIVPQSCLTKCWKNPTNAIQTGVKWRSRNQNPYSGQAEGLGRLQRWCSHQHQPTGWCGRWCLWPNSRPYPKPIYLHRGNTYPKYTMLGEFGHGLRELWGKLAWRGKALLLERGEMSSSLPKK